MRRNEDLVEKDAYTMSKLGQLETCPKGPSWCLLNVLEEYARVLRAQVRGPLLGGACDTGRLSTHTGPIP